MAAQSRAEENGNLLYGAAAVAAAVGMLPAVAMHAWSGVVLGGVIALSPAIVATMRVRRGAEADETRLRTMAARLKLALRDDALDVVYQPIFDAEGRVVGAESLCRWHDAELGPVSPVEFIPVAEATGLIVPLCEWVLRRSCAQMQQWLVSGRDLHRIAVNVSVLQIWERGFVASVEEILRETGLPPQKLELEVTESALVKEFEVVRRNLQALRRLGVRISIDDFGTGYSSLNRLRELEADVLKIDRTFVQSAGDSECGVALVQAIVCMAQTLGLTVVAEGVETQEQWALLKRLGCDSFQGYLLAKPMAASEMTEAALCVA